MQTPKAKFIGTRISWQRAGLVLALLSASTAFAQGDQEDDKGEVVIEINDAQLSGNGCKKGQSKIFSYQSQGPKSPIDSFLMEHNNFTVGKMKGSKRSNTRAFCNAALKIELPVHPDKTKGYQFGILGVRQSGFMKIKEGVTATIKTIIGMRINGALELSATKMTEGPFEGTFNEVMDKFYDKNGTELPYWSVCGREPTFNVKTAIKLNGDSAGKKESGIALDKVSNDDETDQRQQFAQDFRIHWRVCTLPPPPEEDDY